MKLADEEFIRVINTTPLAAIDLIVRNELGEVLLGRRRNRPAQHYWFVPGGRILKNERSQDALQRIGLSELQMRMPSGRLLGVFDHIYQDNYLGLPDIGTHYVTFGYQVEMKKSDLLIHNEHDEQHAELKWWSIGALLLNEQVHQNTKLYFSDTPDNGFRCGCAK
jgi:colanic acid biosynthesis protein WcaH